MEFIHIKANQLYKENEFEEAIKLYSELINNNYKKSIILSNRSACYLNLDNYFLALNDSLRSIELDINMAIAWGRVGYSYKGLKMHMDAVKAFEIANSLNKNNVIYKKEIQYYFNRFDNKINLANIFKLLTNDKKMLNNLKEIKTEIVNVSPNDLFNNKKIVNLIETIIKKIN